MKKGNKIFIISIITFIIILSILIINYIITPKEGELIKITYPEINKKVEQKDTFILVVSQSTCSHCNDYKPKLTKIAKEYGIDIYYIDYDEEKEKKEFLEKFNLNNATPITMFFQNGKETSLMDRLEGDLSSSKVIEKFKEMGFINK
ncbi:MAG: thioredoxin family protein [Erysipelotrichaceae bacterium]|nr:thioredoxin family protein [Erysipelotrichaceae bacterium]